MGFEILLLIGILSYTLTARLLIKGAMNVELKDFSNKPFFANENFCVDYVTFGDMNPPLYYPKHENISQGEGHEIRNVWLPQPTPTLSHEKQT